MNTTQSTIAVCIVTYNQEQYIAQAIESVLMQKCEIPIYIFIGEDNSNDKTRPICLEYKEKYFDKIELTLHNISQGLVKNTISVLNEIKRKGCDYIAMLDGDDYWIDEHKLQKEYDFLKSNPDYGLVHTNISLLWNDRKINKNIRKNVPTGYIFDIINTFSIGNCSVLFCSKLLNYVNLDDFITNQFLSVDYAMYTIFSKYTKIGFLDDITAVWRRGHTSVSHTNDMEKQIAYLENDARMWRYLDSLFPKSFGYNEISVMRYKNYRSFNIAFNWGNYKIANAYSKKEMDKRGLAFSLKKISAKNRLLFYLFILLNKLKNHARQLFKN